MTHDELAILKRLRELCLALPGVDETTSFGHPTFKTNAKTFCVLEHYKGELCIVFKADLPTQQALVQSPRFFTAPYVGKRGWVSLRANGRLDWGEIEDLVTTSHGLVGADTRPAKRRRRATQPNQTDSRTRVRPRRR